MSRFLLPTSIAPLDLNRAKRRFEELLFNQTMRADVCLACGSAEEVKLESSRTAYVKHCKECSSTITCRDGGSQIQCQAYLDTPDPNAPIPLCRPCAKTHHEVMDEQWAAYRTGQM